MDWLSHILWGLLFSGSAVHVPALIIGSFVSDVFFFTQSLFFFFTHPSSQPLIRRFITAYDLVERDAPLQRIGEIVHSIPFFILVLIGVFFIGSPMGWSFMLGFSVHTVLDLLTHKDDRYQLWYPFSKTRYQRGFINWDITRPKLLLVNFGLLILLFLVKKFVLGFFF